MKGIHRSALFLSIICLFVREFPIASGTLPVCAGRACSGRRPTLHVKGFLLAWIRFRRESNDRRPGHLELPAEGQRAPTRQRRSRWSPCPRDAGILATPEVGALPKVTRAAVERIRSSVGRQQGIAHACR
ncbi:MAG: hypothetical protein KDI74_10020 [Gammaproteobacteria bacterium]|nr:hypothetical protein [Gammaproteobacteria bacterium]HXK57128.1 hypothetical protein [Gammaproteobacteria bacterium]